MDMASGDLAVSVITEVGQLSQGCRWTRLMFPGLPMLNPYWIINTTSSTVMDFDLDQEFTQTKQRKLILTELDNFQKTELDNWIGLQLHMWMIFHWHCVRNDKFRGGKIQFLNRITDCIQMMLPKFEWIFFSADIEEILNANILCHN